MTQAQLLTAINTSNAGGLPAGMQAAVITGGRLVLESVDADTQIDITSSSSAGTRRARAAGRNDRADQSADAKRGRRRPDADHPGLERHDDLRAEDHHVRNRRRASVDDGRNCRPRSPASPAARDRQPRERQHHASRRRRWATQIQVGGTAAPLNFGIHTPSGLLVQPAGARSRRERVPRSVDRRRRDHGLRLVGLAGEHPAALGQGRLLLARRRPHRHLEPVLSGRTATPPATRSPGRMPA